jgi:hypothetical protein
MLTTTNLIVLFVLSFLCLGFVIFVWKDVSRTGHRVDARESKKAEDTRTDPFILDKDQQPADLQVGQQDEVRRPNRFVPDQPVR